MSNCQRRFEFWLNMDIFAKEPNLYYQRNKKKPSYIGLVFTIIYIIIYIVFFIYKLVRMARRILNLCNNMSNTIHKFRCRNMQDRKIWFKIQIIIC